MGARKSLALLSLAAGTLAAPWGNQCMTDEQAGVVAAKWGELIANYSEELANAIVTPDFVDWSESVNTLIITCPQGSAAVSLPLLAPTFDTRAKFEIGQGQQPPINFKQLNIWPACSSVALRWETTNTAPIPNPKPVIGLIVIDTVPAPPGSQYPFLISRVFSEFDAGAWLQNLQEAGICPAKDCGPSGPGPAPPGPQPNQPGPQPNQPMPQPNQPAPQPNHPAPQPQPQPYPPHPTTHGWGNTTTPTWSESAPTTTVWSTDYTTTSCDESTSTTWTAPGSSGTGNW